MAETLLAGAGVSGAGVGAAPLMEALIKTLNLREVDTLLRSGLYDFEALRRSYNLPHEPSSYTLLQNQIGLDDTSAQLIGFKVV